MGIEHNGEYNFRPNILLAEVRETETGSLGVWVEWELDEEAWKTCGFRKGLSISFTEPFFHSDIEGNKPLLVMSVDLLHFDETTFRDAVGELLPYFTVQARRLYQLSDLPPAQVLIEIGIGVAGNVLAVGMAAAIKAALKRFLHPKTGQETIFRFKQGTTETFLQTNNEELLEKTVDQVLIQSSVPPIPPAQKKTSKQKKTP